MKAIQSSSSCHPNIAFAILEEIENAVTRKSVRPRKHIRLSLMNVQQPSVSGTNPDAAIAIPQYQNYTGRAQLSDAIVIASGLKTAVGEYYQINGSYTGADSGSGGIPGAVASGAGKYANSVTVADGVITLQMNGSGVASCVASAHVTLAPSSPTGDAPISWTCNSDASAGCKPSTCT